METANADGTTGRESPISLCWGAPNRSCPGLGNRLAVFRVAGTIVAAVGGNAWDPTCDLGLLTATDSESFGFRSCIFKNVAPGQYEFKVAPPAAPKPRSSVASRY
jgi:hypothetical protein